MLEYDNRKGFKCQRCSSWTLGGNLYSGYDGLRICFTCHIEEVSSEMTRKYSTLDDKELIPDLECIPEGPYISLEKEDIRILLSDPVRKKIS